MGDFFKFAFPKDYHQAFIDKGVRPDGRVFNESREAAVSVGDIKTANGSSMAVIGNTKVFCGIKAKATMTKPGERILDFVVTKVEFPVARGQPLRWNQVSDQSQITTQYVQNFLESTNMLKVEDLMDKDGKFFWVLECELVCADDSGSLLDACCLALVAALLDVRLPQVTFNETSDRLDVNEEEKKCLQLRCRPVVATFANWSKEILLADPTKGEEEVSEGTTTIAYDSFSEKYMIHLAGGCESSKESLQVCLKAAQKRSKSLLEALDSVTPR